MTSVMDTSRTEFSLVIPTLDEKDNILVLIGHLERTLAGIDYEIIVADDNSPDRTWEIVQNYSAKNPRVRALRRMDNFDLSAAVIDGFDIAHGRFLGVMDADLSHDWTILPKLIDAVRAGADIAVGSRKVAGGGAENWPLMRRLFSGVATLACKLWLNVPINDPMSGYFVIRREVFEKVKGSLNPKGYKILLELAARSRTRAIVEIPFVFKDRTKGYSKLSTKVAAKYLSMLWDLKR